LDRIRGIRLQEIPIDNDADLAARYARGRSTADCVGRPQPGGKMAALRMGKGLTVSQSMMPAGV